MTPDEVKETVAQLETEMDRGAKAHTILESPLFREAMELLETSTLETWKTSPVRDTEGQLALRLRWQVIQQFKAHFTDALQTGKLATEQMNQERPLFERILRLVKRKG